MPKLNTDQFRIKPNSKFRLKDYDPGWIAKELRELGKDALKAKAKDFLQENTRRLAEAQDIFYANDRYSLLIILQAMDAAGKDGIIKHVMSGINPQGCSVYSFKVPSAEELDHTFLWRYMKALPERGRIAIFNRSHYEEVLVVKVHPELLEKQRLPKSAMTKTFWEDRYDDINNFERHLARNGTLVLKFFLHLSRKEQKERFLERIDTPEKNWKFSSADLKERSYWNDYQKAFEEAISRTSKPWAPWYVVPADNKPVARSIVSAVIRDTLKSLDIHYPKLNKEQLDELKQARETLLAE
jgi:PPK2 family polyphosphate:nucleotide phosphotransferase